MTPLGSRRPVGWTHLRVSPLALETMQLGGSVSDVGAFDLEAALLDSVRRSTSEIEVSSW